MQRPRPSCFVTVALALVWTAAAGLSSCAAIPKGQYGVDRIEWIGAKALDDKAVESCLVTRERPRVSFMLGVSAPSCGKPPFDSSPPTLELWRLPWTQWPVFDPAIFDVERERIERWYHARGYYDVKVMDVKTFVGNKPVDPNECHGKGSQCELKVVVSLREGAPTYVEHVEIKPSSKLPQWLMERLRENLHMRKGQRLDEYDYNEDKETLQTLMLAAAYARAKVTGHVLVDRNRRSARVEFDIDPGPECEFGDFTIEGAQGDVPTLLLIQAANIRRGTKYDQEQVDDAQRAIFSLKVFSSVRVERRGTGKVVDLVAVVQRGRITRWSAGVGLMSGTMVRPSGADFDSVPQWDVHLAGSYENRNFLGGLRLLRMEERPRVIFLRQFPGVAGGPKPGNIISLRFEQPATFERRTKLIGQAGWDVGPDPYLGFFRHDIGTKISLERPFLRQRLFGRIAVAHDFYSVTEDIDSRDTRPRNDAGDLIPDTRAPLQKLKDDPLTGVTSYKLPYLEQQVTVDLRDDPQRPSKGMYFSFLIQEANKLGNYGSWNYVRLQPDLRAYVPLPLAIVLAARVSVGALMITSYSESVQNNEIARRLGPNVYRLRGGGPNSNRGFLAGRLGDSYFGGTRRWEGSLELRIPLGDDFGVVAFGDVGDVSDMGLERRADGVTEKKPAFRFNHPNTSAGVGLRYFSVLGAIRLDAGWRVPGWQTTDDSDTYKGTGAPSAVHLTIGEAF